MANTEAGSGSWHEWLGWGLAVLFVLVIMQSNRRAGAWLLVAVTLALVIVANKRGVFTWTR